MRGSLHQGEAIRETRRESKSTTGIYDSPVPRPPPFLNTLTKSATTQTGMRLSLLIETALTAVVYTRRVKEAIHIRLHPNNFSRDNGIKIPESLMSTIKNKKQQQQKPTEER